MPNHPGPQSHTSTEDEAFLAGARRFRERLSRHPFALGVVAVLAAALLFLLGVRTGEILYLAFDGDTLMPVVFGGTFTLILLVIVAIGALLDRRRHTRDANARPLTDAQRDRLRSYLYPASAVVRWYQPVAVVAFVALAVPGVLLLPTPWDGLWVLGALAANPVARWLRAQGHVLTTRDLGFPVPGLSPWPSIVTAALAATAGMTIAVLLWSDALDTTVATVLTGLVLAMVIIGGGLATEQHQRRHITRLLGRPGGRPPG